MSVTQCLYIVILILKYSAVRCFDNSVRDEGIY